MNYSVEEIAKIVDGELLGSKEVTVNSIDFDSRNIKSGAIFVPILAQRDGHAFINDALNNGAVASFVTHFIDSPITQIKVNDTQVAFGQLAHDYVQRINPGKIAVTGSNGKTTTKDLISSILSVKYKVHHTIDSLNNELGVPKTILDMPEDTEMLVVEMGMDRPLQISALSKILEPEIAVITMIGEAHIEFFKTRDKIADAKFEIVDGLNHHGLLLYNGDEPLLQQRALDFLSKDEHHRAVGFGLQKNNEYRLSDVKQKNNQLNFNFDGRNFSVNLLGDFNAMNTTAAIAVGEILDLSDEQIQEGLNNLSLTQNRLSILKGNNEEIIISDVYNSNPTAAIEAIKIINQYSNVKNKYLVLGDMLELGENSLELHEKLIEPINNSDIKEVFLVGNIFAQIAPKIIKPVKVFNIKELEKLTDILKKTLQSNDLILLKASHGIHLENILQNLVN
ncbi:MAG: UDP-N-acetylmuramoyl-tripeptide--D-alanyl-D-alanine ligase [Lactobacillaceae bacterium]|jgi:UDP-N-acetylmuramoyl-tripeptide--D-alanyl-D-alanine ligase|nr:UDP-N-acetylmuramoyl-tripeptide--D-alanyl-D-alanine ligase [Lactobacillaceae bacterium]